MVKLKVGGTAKEVKVMELVLGKTKVVTVVSLKVLKVAVTVTKGNV